MRTPATIFACLLLAACGEVHGFTDAGDTGDDTQDADTTPDAAAVGPVNVTALRRCCTDPGGPVAGVEVVSVDGDGALRDRAATGAAGTATIEVARGGSVTVVYPPTEFDEIRISTIAAVEPGDDLTFGDRFTGGTGAQQGTMRVTWPAAANISTWYAYTNCGGYYAPGAATETTVYRFDYPYCQTATTDIILIGYDTTLSEWARHGTLQDVTWVDSGAVSFAGTQLQTTSTTLRATGLPPEVDYVGMSAYPMLGEMGLPGVYASGTPSGGTFSQVRQLLPVGEGLSLHLELDRPGDFGYQFTRARAAAGATTIEIADAAVLPWVGPSAASSAARSITWIQLGDAPYDLAHVRFSWSSGGSFLFGKGGRYYSWDLYLPPGIDELQFPELPGALAQHAPPPDRNLYPYIELVESELFDGFADARTHPEWAMECPSCVPAADPMPRTTYSTGGSGGDLTDALPGAWMRRAARARAR